MIDGGNAGSRQFLSKREREDNQQKKGRNNSGLLHNPN